MLPHTLWSAQGRDRAKERVTAAHHTYEANSKAIVDINSVTKSARNAADAAPKLDPLAQDERGNILV